MQFKFVAAVIAAVLAVAVAQDAHEDGYQVNPKFKKPEVPKVPEAPEYKKPEIPEYKKPEIPEYKKPEIPEYKKPEIPEYKKPEIPEYKKPEIPEYKKPEIPEYEKPEFPKYEKPEFPKYEKPEFPKYEKPEFPKYEKPEYPKFEKPEVPEYMKPEFPEYEKPEFPKYEKPEYPEHMQPEYMQPEYMQPEFPKYEKPEYPEHMQHEFPKYEKRAVPEYEHPEYPSYAKHEMPEYQEQAYPSYPEHQQYVHPHPAPYYAGYPDFTATEPPMEEMKMEKKDGDYTPHDSKMKMEKMEEKMEKKDGDYTPHDSKMKMEKMEEKMEKKDGDYTPHDSKMEEKMMKDHEGFPVFNFHEYELPKIEEHNFDNFKFNLTGYNPKDENSTDSDDYFKIQESQEVPVARTYQPYTNGYYHNEYPVPSPYTPHGGDAAHYNTGYPHHQQEPAVYPHHQTPEYAQHNTADYNQPEYHQQPYQPTYQPTGHLQYENKNTVEKQGSYYRLDTCEYRFILDMVQCHQEEKYTEKVNVQSKGQGHYYQGQGPNYYDSNNYYYNPAGQYNNGYNYQVPYDSRYMDFMHLYGNPMYYTNHATGQSYKPGHFDDSLFSYSPAVGHPFYAPGLHNTPFAQYYAGFRAGQFEQGHEAETRNYHKEGHYQSAVQDFHNLKLKNVVKVNSESESSVKTSSKVSVSDEVGYEGVTPSLGYRVRLLPNHCSVPGYGGKHTCILFSGATHPYRMVHRQFVYLKNTREVQGMYRYRYENGQQVQQQH